ncbi:MULTISPECIES: ParA family protein [unclassified Pseudonocardia]|uniref:ParA family protein n=1 Tax=unclassified Pseudonocardia TaxID=2619320 RepID=UPI0014822671|nr:MULTISPECIES: ParA family protein [unclassified Pseudonocardia]
MIFTTVMRKILHAGPCTCSRDAAMMSAVISPPPAASLDLLASVEELRAWSRTTLAGHVIAVAAGKGGVGKSTLAAELAYCLDAVLVDADWDDGCVSRALGWRRETRARSPLLDALDSGRAPRLIRGGTTKPDLVPAGPDLEAHQPRPEKFADHLTRWAREWKRPVVIDTHPGSGAATYGAMAAAHVVPCPTELGEKDLNALAGWCEKLQGYPLYIVPSQVPKSPADSHLDWLDKIAITYDLKVSSEIPRADWLPQRKARTALCAAKSLSKRNTPMISAYITTAREVAERARNAS